MTDQFHPDLRLARFLPRTIVWGWSLPLMRQTDRLVGLLNRGAEVVQIGPDVSVRVRRPAGPPRGALLWIHGGGLLFGSSAQDDRACKRYSEELGLLVASVDYRLPPAHPYPAPLADCVLALEWLLEQPDVPAGRVAVGGASAGGGLAAAVALTAKERGIPLLLQLLRYPMLDDRTILRTDVDGSRLRVWSPSANRLGWTSYLPGLAGGSEVPPLAAPARYLDLRGVAPAWIGVGTRDLFHDEDLAYARRLEEAGVPVTTTVVPGAYHGFDTLEVRAPVARAFAATELAALREAFEGTG